MAKKGQGMPYAYDVIKAGPTRAGIEIREKTMQTIVLELQDLVNSYYSQDWPFVVAAMEIVQGVVKHAMGPLGVVAAADLVKGSQAVWSTDTNVVDTRGVTQPPTGGGNAPSSMRGGGGNG